jgi:hypothetical protein
MTNSAYAKNKGDGLLCSILWYKHGIFSLSGSTEVLFFEALK